MTDSINKLRVLDHMNTHKTEDGVIGEFLGQEVLQLIPSALELEKTPEGTYELPLILPLEDHCLCVMITLHIDKKDENTFKTTHTCEVREQPYTQLIIPLLDNIKNIIDFIIETKFKQYENKHTHKS